MTDQITTDPSKPAQRMGAGSMTLTWGPWIVAAIALMIMPYVFTSNSALTIMNQMWITVVFALAYNMLLGQGGMLSFGHAVYAGVDVGGTNIKIGLVSDDGRTIAHTKFPTQQESGPQRAVDQAKVVIDQLLEESGISRPDLVAVGLGTPGPMDVANGILLTPSNLPAWHNFPIKDALSKATGLPVSYANDAAAAAYGEFWVGAGASHDSIVPKR